jgi:hypothetical protein
VWIAIARFAGSRFARSAQTAEPAPLRELERA